MSRDWESTFGSWAKAPSTTELTKCQHAETAIREAVKKDETLGQHDIIVFPQGSYRNRTNVRADSDVDICILCHGTFFYGLPDGMAAHQFGIEPSSYPYATFKNDVDHALREHFGMLAVTRGNKAFDIHQNTYRVDADAVACFDYRLYRADGSWEQGTSFLPDNGGQVINYPEQNYSNGVSKNTATNRRFKGAVRILKRLRNEMADGGNIFAKPIPSFLIECLVWNVPNVFFAYSTWTETVREILVCLFRETSDSGNCSGWGEINRIKYLFHPTQQWTQQIAHNFITAAWNHVGFE